MKNKHITIAVYKSRQRIATYHYKRGHLGELLEGLKSFYSQVYPSHTMTYSVNTGAHTA